MFNTIDPNYASLSNGYLLRTKSWSLDLNIHKSHLVNFNNMVGSKQPPTSLGVINDIAHLTGLGGIFQPTYWGVDINNPNRVVKTVDNEEGVYTYQKMAHSDNNKAKIMSIEVVGDQTRPGIDSNPVYLTLDKRIAGANAIFAFSQMSGVQLKSEGQPSGSNAEGYRYKMTLTSTDSINSFIDPLYLKVGRYITVIGAVDSEYNTEYDSRTLTGKMLNFYNTIGNASNQKFFTISLNASRGSIDNAAVYSLAQHQQLLQIDFMNPQSKAYKLSMGTEIKGASLKQLAADGGFDNARTSMRAFIPQIEAYYMQLINAENEYYAMFGSGGSTMINGDKVTLPRGLFHQMMQSANKYSYNIGGKILDKIRSSISKITHNRFTPDSNKQIIVKTGQGGLMQAQREITELMGTIPGVFNTNEFLTNKTGNNLELGYRFGMRRFSHPLGNYELVFMYEPSLDSEFSADPNQIDNPVIKNGFRLSSYVYIIDDLEGDGGYENIVRLEPSQTDRDFHVWWLNGKVPYIGDPNRHGSSSNKPNTEVYLSKRYHGYALVKPEKTLLILPINHITQRPYGQSMLDRL